MENVMAFFLMIVIICVFGVILLGVYDAGKKIFELGDERNQFKYQDIYIPSTYELLDVEESRLPIPRQRSRTFEEVTQMIDRRAELAEKLNKARDIGQITQE